MGSTRSIGTEIALERADAHRALEQLLVDVDPRRLGGLLQRVRASAEGAALLVDRPRLDDESCDLHDLRRLPHGTFGREYAQWMIENGFRPSAGPPIRLPSQPGDAPEVRYLRERVVQVHDLWHVLTGYNRDVAGELGLLAFTLGQTRSPRLARVLLRVAGRDLAASFRGRRRPWSPLLRYLWRAWRRGRRARFLLPVAVEDYWILPLDAVRQRLGIEPASGPALRGALPPIAEPA